MANWLNGTLTLEGKLKNIRRLLADQLVRSVDQTKVTKDEIINLSKGDGHLHFTLPDAPVRIHEACRTIVDERVIEATAESDESYITLKLIISQCNCLDEFELLDLSKQYNLNMVSDVGEFMNNVAYKVVIHNNEIVEVVEGEFMPEEEYMKIRGGEPESDDDVVPLF